MDEARVARALNRLGEDAFLFANDSEDLLELVDEYFGDTTPTGKIRCHSGFVPARGFVPGEHIR